MISTLLSLFILLCIVGVILWGVQAVPGIPPIFKTAIYVVAAVILLLWLLRYVQGGHVGHLV